MNIMDEETEILLAGGKVVEDVKNAVVIANPMDNNEKNCILKTNE